MKNLASLFITFSAITVITILSIILIQSESEPYLIMTCIIAISGLGGYHLKQSNNQKKV